MGGWWGRFFQFQKPGRGGGGSWWPHHACNLPQHPSLLPLPAPPRPPLQSLREIISNSKLSEHYLTLARDLDVVEAKTPEDVYKTHLTEGRAPAGAAAVDSARANLAATFVNAFVNAGFGQDKLVTVSGGDAGA